MIAKVLVVGPFACNCVILGDEKTREAVVIDPGDDAETIQAEIAREKLSIRWFLHTHAHLDHIGATQPLAEQTQAIACLHPDDLPLAEHVDRQAALFGLPSPPRALFPNFLKDGDQYRFGESVIEVLHTPGHTPGSVCFHLASEGRLFSGDTLFAGSIGRTDLWGGSYEQIIRSIKERLLTLDERTLVIPGHGSQTTIGVERRSNPFVSAYA